MIRWLFTRRSIARLAICLLLFMSFQVGLNAHAAHGARRFVEVTTAAAKTNPRHDHTNTICHSCPGHGCLELHGAFDQASGPPPLLANGGIVIIEPWPAAESWAHPPTAPPRTRLTHNIALPRAPPSMT